MKKSKKTEKESEQTSEKPSKKQVDEQNRTLKNIFIWLGIFVLVIIIVSLSINSAKHFEYKGVEFNVIKEGEIIFYNAVFPIYHRITGKHIEDYNIYLRNNPRKLENIPFDGEVILRKDTVINTTKDFNCDGDGIIATANLVQVLERFGTNVIKNPELGCDALGGKYIFIQIREGEETSIEQFAPTCYNLYVNNCEILEVTEKFIVDLLVKAEKNRE
ncbi:hypothetical protein KAT80_03100 [Candidatus Pacearchaeota archaeon]|nr:hypothetical protein [Candidatus Pacearchaeota archaeon]